MSDVDEFVLIKDQSYLDDDTTEEDEDSSSMYSEPESPGLLLSELTEPEPESEPESEPEPESKVQETTSLSDDYTTIQVTLPYLSTKYTGKYKVIYSYPFLNSPLHYIGELVDGKRYGEGTLTYPNYTKKGYFEENEIVHGSCYNELSKYTGEFDYSLLQGDNCVINKHGFIFQGTVMGGIPLFEYGYAGFDPHIVFEFMGCTGPIQAVGGYKESNSYIEGSLTIGFKGGFLKQVTIWVCLHADTPTKSGYEDKFSDVVKVGNIVLADDSVINEEYVYVKLRKNTETNTIHVLPSVVVLPPLFKTVRELPYRTKVVFTQSFSADQLLLGVLIALPHLPVVFLQNLKKYSINGNQLWLLSLNYLLYDLFDTNKNPKKSAYEELKTHTYVTQLEGWLLGRHPGNYLAFHKDVTNPTIDKNLAMFVKEHKLDLKTFKRMDINLLKKVFDPIYIFLLQQASKDC